MPIGSKAKAEEVSQRVRIIERSNRAHGGITKGL
jgi:hypothetical protein